jgi:hypothetical protein
VVARLLVLGALFDAHVWVVGEPGGQAPVVVVELAAPVAQIDARFLGQAEAAAHPGAGVFPGGVLEQDLAGVAPLVQAGHEHVVAAQCAAQGLGGADDPGVFVDAAGVLALGGEHACLPDGSEVLDGDGGERLALVVLGQGPLQRGQKLQRLHQGAGLFDALQAEVLGQTPQRLVDGAVAGGQFGGDGLSLGPGQFADGARGLVHGGDVEQVEAAADIALGVGGGVAEGDPRLAQHQGGGVQVAQGAHALLGGQIRRGTGQVGHQHVEDLDRLVRGPGAHRGGECHQGGHPARLGEVGDRAGAYRGGVAGQRVQAADGNGGQVPAGGAELVELDEPVDGLARAGAGDVTRGTA